MKKGATDAELASEAASDLIFLAAFRCRKWKYSCGAGVAEIFERRRENYL